MQSPRVWGRSTTRVRYSRSLSARIRMSSVLPMRVALRLIARVLPSMRVGGMMLRAMLCHCCTVTRPPSM